MYAGAAADVQLDAQGRFVLPEDQRRHAAIGRDVKVLGQHNRIEIWDAERKAGLLAEAFDGVPRPLRFTWQAPERRRAPTLRLSAAG